MRNYKFSLVLLLCASLLSHADQVFCQGTFELGIGIGLPDELAVKIKYGNNFQVGLSQGAWFVSIFGEPMRNWATLGEFSWHFAGKSEFTDQKPWYMSLGGGYWFGEDCYLATCRIGKYFNLDNDNAIVIDLGVFLRSVDIPDPNPVRILPAGSLFYYFRL